MAYRGPAAEPFRESIRSANSTSVYSTDSTSSPLDSIIRDYPVVPGASPNAFQFSPRTPAYYQQQGITTRLREYSPPAAAIDTPKPFNDTQTFERPGSSPLLHTRFRSPTDSDPTRPDSSQTDAPAPENFIDLRESGAYETVGPQNNSNLSYGYTRGVAPIPGHGVRPAPQFNDGNLAPVYGQQPTSRFSPITPETEVDEVDFSSQARGGYTKNQNGLAVVKDDYDRGSWGTQYSEQNAARQTWMTTTSGVTTSDPFSFRHFESPQASAVPQGLNAPKLVVHGPLATEQTYSNGQPDDANDFVAYVPPSPIEAVPQGRMPSKVPIANRYNFSRPMRSELRVSNASTATNAVRGSEYSSMSTSTDIHRTVSGFPDPPMPEPLAPSAYPDQFDQSTRRAMKRMSVPKTMPNLAYTDDQLSPSPTTKDLASSASPRSNPMQLSSSPGTSQSNRGLAPRGLSPIRDRSPSPSGGTYESVRYQSQSPIPPPPRSYEVPYSYHVTITDHEYQNPYGGTTSDTSHSSGHMTRYSQGGTALPPAPREVVALPSSPPPVGPRPGSNLSLYSRYSFYSANDLPESGAPTPRGWEKNGSAERLRNGGVSPSRSDQTPTPTAGMKMKGKSKDDSDYSALPYLNNVPAHGSTDQGPPTSSTDQTTISPQECLLLGISHHEADRLEESAYWFEKAANENGGCGVGMFMWGLSLRHAWGVERDERAAFWWLRRAAECAVADMERTREARPDGGDGDIEKERDRKAVQSELVLAVYEVGQCFFHGWGVETDKKMAVSYFQVAARLGDMDAQLELGFCFAKGKGCKKDLKESAKWYRAAAAQGASTIGLAWIYKPKYGGGSGDEQVIDISAQHPILPSSKGAGSTVTSSARSTTGKSEPRRLKKPPPRSRTPSARSPAPTNASITDSGYQ